MKFSPRLRSITAGVAIAALGATGCVAAPGSSGAAKPGASTARLDRFPVTGPVRYGNDFGASRGGGSRRHQGVDVMAKRGQGVVAVESGTITSATYSSNCGYSLGLAGDDGNYYLYCHLNNYASGVSTGKRVWAGKQVGSVGSTGNASEAYPHLHIELHPNGARGAAVNPYSLLRSAENRTGVVASPPKGWR